MKFVAKERKTIDAVRWTGKNVVEVVEWAHALGLVIVQEHGGVDVSALVWKEPERGVVQLWACTLHGEVEIEPGSWAAYGGTDVYPLSDGELRRLYAPGEISAEEGTAIDLARHEVVDEYVDSFSWSEEVPADVRALVAGNVRGAVAWWVRDGEAKLRAKIGESS